MSCVFYRLCRELLRLCRDNCGTNFVLFNIFFFYDATHTLYKYFFSENNQCKFWKHEIKRNHLLLLLLLLNSKFKFKRKIWRNKEGATVEGITNFNYQNKSCQTYSWIIKVIWWYWMVNVTKLIYLTKNISSNVNYFNMLAACQFYQF